MATSPTLPLRAAARDDVSAPPAHPDSTHVLHGCYISTAAYLARFTAEFPAERGIALVVELRGFESQHTIALVSWRGCWWGRDEFFGVFALGCEIARHPDPARLDRQAAAALLRHAEREIRAGRAAPAPRPPSTLPADERRRLIVTAAAVLPCKSEVFWVGRNGEEIPLLFFSPAPGQFAVYDPLTGTAQAECTSTNTTGIVRAFAAGLGYPADTIRREPGPPVG